MLSTPPSSLLYTTITCHAFTYILYGSYIHYTSHHHLALRSLAFMELHMSARNTKKRVQSAFEKIASRLLYARATYICVKTKKEFVACTAHIETPRRVLACKSRILCESRFGAAHYKVERWSNNRSLCVRRVANFTHAYKHTHTHTQSHIDKESANSYGVDARRL